MSAKTPLAFFEDNLGYARNLVAIARAVDTQTTPALDVSDILRAALVSGVSALDHFVHEKVRTRMMETFAKGDPGTDAFQRFSTPLGAVQAALTSAAPPDWLDAEIRSQHGLLSFQKPDKIADAIRLISPIKLWEEVASALGSDAQTVKRELTLIVDRRNKIAHEADVDPTPPHDRWPISYPDVDNALGYMDSLGHTIDGLC